MIEIQNVVFTYPGGDEPVLRDLSLEVPQGRFVALIGNNGSGKTSLCKLLTGLIPQFFEGDFEGYVRVNGLDTLETRVAELARHVGYVYQDFENQLLKPQVLEDVSFGPLNFGMPDYIERGEHALGTLGLSGLADRLIWELSGGEQHLVALAGALAMDPGIIVVDEPISQLDPVNADTIYDKLAMLHREMGKTIIVIEHHPDFIGSYCDSVVLLKKGQVVWQLPVREALSRVDELADNDIFAPQVTRIAHQVHDRTDNGAGAYPINLHEGARYFAGHNLDQVGSETGTAPQDTDGEPQLSTASPRPVLVAFEHLTHAYELINRSRRVVLEDVHLQIHEGERVALVGANGAGKSTLMKLIAGLEKPKQGIVHVLDHDTRSTSPERLADDISLVYQTPQQMFIEDSVRGDVAYYLKERGVPDADALVERALEEFLLTDLQERDGRLLSGGQMRRASLAIAACMRPKVLLLDEPTSSLDVANRRQIKVMLSEMLEDWVKTIIIATHDMELVAEWAGRVIVLRQGRVIADAAPEAIFGNPQLLTTARIRAPQVVQLSHRLDMRPVALSVEHFVARLGGHRVG